MILPEIDEPIHLVEGARNLWIRNRLLHSRFDSFRELSRFLSANIDPLTDHTRLLLIGAGCLDEMLVPSAQRLQLTLFEPIPAVRARYATLPVHLCEQDVGDLADYDRIIILPAYRRLFPDWADAIDAILQGAQTARPLSLDGRTQAHFLRLWMRNYAMRMNPAVPPAHPLLASGNPSGSCVNPAVASLSFFEGISPNPAGLLFCGAGPHLLEELQAIEATHGTTNPPGMFVAVADTAAAAVLQAGWRIDIIISIDSGPGTAYHLAMIPPELRHGLPVLSWLPGSAFIERAGFPCLFVPTLFPLDQFLATSLPLPDAWRNPFRNVMGYAFTLQQRCKIPTLTLAGCGFRERHGSYYTRGTGYALFHSLQSHRLNPLESLDLLLTQRQRHANRQAASLLQQKQTGVDPDPPLKPGQADQPRATCEQNGPDQPGTTAQAAGTFRLLRRTLDVAVARKRLASPELPASLEGEYGPAWANLYRRHGFYD